MRTLLIASLVYMLASCSVSHTIFYNTRPCLYPHKGVFFALCEEFPVLIDNKLVVVPAEFYTNLASIPRLFWFFNAPNDTPTIPGAILHDYLYTDHYGYTREQIDSIFYDTLVLEGVPKYTAFKYWLAVRLFGGSYFNE